MRQLIVCLLLSAVPGLLRGQTPDAKPVEFRGHYIGESIRRFLHLEADARENLEVCQQHPTQSSCQKLFAAVELGQRAEITTLVPVDTENPDAPRDALNFVLEGKKLVKMTMLVSDVADIMKTLGRPSSESAVPTQNSEGVKWENHLTVWQTTDIYASLYQDNNPSLQDKRPVLTVESPAEHAREDANSAKSSTAHQ